MFITGRCSGCGCPIGLKQEELGKKQPPKICDACKSSGEQVMNLFHSLKDIARGGRT